MLEKGVVGRRPSRVVRGQFVEEGQDGAQLRLGRLHGQPLRRADVPMAYSSGFNPHPRISYAGAERALEDTLEGFDVEAAFAVDGPLGYLQFLGQCLGCHLTPCL